MAYMVYSRTPTVAAMPVKTRKRLAQEALSQPPMTVVMSTKARHELRPWEKTTRRERVETMVVSNTQWMQSKRGRSARTLNTCDVIQQRRPRPWMNRAIIRHIR